MELAVHTLLYVRQIYPFSLFEQRIVYGIPVYQCADDTIRHYIWKAMDALAEELLVVSHIPKATDRELANKTRQSR